jgi:flagellar biosynthesis/type III secretory pathway chaperone
MNVSRHALRTLPLAFLFLCASVWPAETLDQQARRIEAALTRITQEQQALYQQFQMIQQLRTNEERQLLPIPTTVPPSPNYEDITRERYERAQRVRDLQAELDRLYGRYRELEEQKRPLLDALSALAQQRAEEAAAAQAQPPQTPAPAPAPGKR